MHHTKAIIADMSDSIRRGKGKLEDHVGLAAFAGLVDDKNLAEQLISASAVKYSGPMEHWVYAMFFHSTGNKQARNRHLGIVLPMLLDDPFTFRREPLGESPEGSVFVIANPVFRDDAAFRLGVTLQNLRDQADRDYEAGVLYEKHERYFAAEPWVVDFFGNPRIPVYVRTQLRGKTLLQSLESGESGLDDVLDTWEMRRILHRGIRPDVSRVGYVPLREKLLDALSKEHLRLPQDVIALILSYAEVVEQYRNGRELVFVTDAHGDNTIVSGSSKGVIDLEDKGIAPAEYDAVKLFRWRRVRVLEGKEQEFLKQADIEEFPYLLEAVHQAVSLFSFFSRPDRSHLNHYAPEKISDARLAIAQIRDSYPASYAAHRLAFERTLEGLDRLAELHPAA